jgi:hypothetical protein
LENSRTKRGDVSDLQELEAVLEHMEMLQTMSDSLREQQFQAIIELGVELQDILQEIKKLHSAYPLPEGDVATPVKSLVNTPDCSLDTPRRHDGPALQNTRIPQNPRKIRKKKKKQISPPSPPQTLKPEKTDQTQHLPTNSTRDATASEKTNQTQHSPTSETLKPRRDILDFTISADAKNPNPRALTASQAKPACSMSSYADSYYLNHADVREAPTNYRRNPQEQVKAADNLYYYFLNSDYSDEYYSDDEYFRDPDVDNLYRNYLKPDYSDEYYSDEAYSRDPDVDYADTTCYQPGASTRSSYASGASHPGISTQPWQCQPNSSSGKSLVKQDPQNRSYLTPRKARKRQEASQTELTFTTCCGSRVRTDQGDSATARPPTYPSHHAELL